MVLVSKKDANMFEIVKNIIVEEYQVNPDVITPESRMSDLDLDSLAFVDLLFRIEDAIGKKIPESAIQPDQVDMTLGELCTLIQKL